MLAHTVSSTPVLVHHTFFLSRNVLHTSGLSLADYHISGSHCSFPYNTCTRNWKLHLLELNTYVLSEFLLQKCI